MLVVVCLTGCATKEQTSVVFPNGKIAIEVADSNQEKYQGLSNRDSICPDCGMLFVFKPAQKTGFVMRNMKFALDMIGIRDGKVVAIDKNCQPEAIDKLTVYQNKEAVDYVLEVNAGVSDRLGVRVGDAIEVQ